MLTMPRLAGSCLLSALVASAGGRVEPAFGASLAETIQRVKPSVVGVGTVNALRQPVNRLSGSGFIVGDGAHVVTSHHVAKPSREPVPPGGGTERLVVFLGSGKTVDLRRARVVAADPDHDTVLLRFDGKPGRPLRLHAGDGVAEGRAVAFTGYPIGFVYGLHPVTHRGIISAVTPIAIPQLSARLLDRTMIQRLKSGFDVYQLDATAYPGNSGSPLSDPETGQVLGIVSSVFVKATKEKILSDPSGITFAIPIGYARELLATAGLRKETPHD